MVSAEGAFTGGIGAAIVLAAVFWVVGLVVGGYSVWTQAPVVGGALWPYIHAIATVIGGFIAAKVGAVVGYIVGAIIGAVLGGFLG